MNKATCKVGGVLGRRGRYVGICGAIAVGGVYCASKNPCEHKVEPKPQPSRAEAMFAAHERLAKAQRQGERESLPQPSHPKGNPFRSLHSLSESERRATAKRTPEQMRGESW